MRLLVVVAFLSECDVRRSMGPHFLSGHMGSSAGVASTAGAVLALGTVARPVADAPAEALARRLLDAFHGVSSSERVRSGAGRFFVRLEVSCGGVGGSLIMLACSAIMASSSSGSMSQGPSMVV